MMRFHHYVFVLSEALKAVTDDNDVGDVADWCLYIYLKVQSVRFVQNFSLNVEQNEDYQQNK